MLPEHERCLVGILKKQRMDLEFFGFDGEGVLGHRTNSQNRDTLLCQGVTKNLTPCRINIKIFKKYHVKAYDQSFPIMYNTI